jgi:hypothetical protein
MPTIGEILRRYGDEYRDRFGEGMPWSHKQVMDALAACRTGELGCVRWHCDACGADYFSDRSCGNRHCPQCQHAKADRWVRRELDRLLPCEYFMVTFTVPAEARSYFRSNQRPCYDAMFQAASAAIKKLARDPRFVGARDLAFFAVMQTWGSQLQFHPHLHVVMAAGGLDSEGQWHAARSGFLFRVEPLSEIYRAKMKQLLTKAGSSEDLPPIVWTKGWNVHCQSVGSGDNAVRYVGRYVFRVAISNSHIVSCENHRVVFRYDDKDSGTEKLCSLDALEFLRRLLQHTLPKGFVKVRHYGLLHHNARHSIEEIRLRIFVATGKETGETANRDEAATSAQAVPPCPVCGKPMRLVAVMSLSHQASG